MILANGMYSGSGTRSDSPPPPSRPTGDVKLNSVNGEESADEAFISFLRDTLSGVTAASSDFGDGVTIKHDRGSFTSAKSLVGAKIKLTDEAVAKVVPRGVTHLDLAPYDPDGPLVAAAGDKDGNVGLWRVDYEAPGGADDEGDGSDDGVLFTSPTAQRRPLSGAAAVSRVVRSRARTTAPLGPWTPRRAHGVVRFRGRGRVQRVRCDRGR